MLTRVSGGTDGIKEYLETGQKAGRHFTRDELDERVILSGDLAATDTIIQRMDNEGEKYLHITLALKEDHIDRDALAAIAREFEQFAFAAYRSDEYNFYAEAHLPKIKGYANERSGKLIERKPHIHIVIPKTNLLTGQHLNPFGMVEHNVRFIDAMQEHINNKFGLASPKDHRRVRFTDDSEMISRYKGDLFEGQGKDLKARILAQVIDSKIDSYDDFKATLAEFGEFRTRNAGKPGEYQNVKPAGAEKGVNLKDYVFSREFIELIDAEKRQCLAADFQHTYDSAGDPRMSPAELEASLQDWHERRAREVKYLNSGSKFWKTYKNADAADQSRLLADFETDFYRKYSPEIPHEQSSPSSRQRRFGTAPRGPQAKTINGLRSLSELDVVRFSQGGEVLLQRHAPDQLEHDRAERADALRWADDDKRLNPATGRESDSVISQIARDHRERKRGRAIEAKPEFAEIKARLDAGRLLAELSQSHGVIVDKYEVTKGKDGSDRIRCGTRHLNVSDFLTKELNFPWADAAVIMRESYARQTSDEPIVDPVREPQKRLWDEYQLARVVLQNERTAKWNTQRQAERERRAVIKNVFYTQRGKIQGDRSLRPAERKAALAVARMQRLQAEATLRDRIKAERANFRTGKKSRDEYRDFLTKKAQTGNERALAELRRMRATPPKKKTPTDSLITGEAAADRDKAPINQAGALTYAVHRNGDVTYQRAGLDVLRDAGRSVQILQEDTQTIETALRLAQVKFGSRLSLDGTAEFKKAAARVAVEAGLKVEFSDPTLNQIMQDRRDEIEAEKMLATTPASIKVVGAIEQKIEKKPSHLRALLEEADRELDAQKRKEEEKKREQRRRAERNKEDGPSGPSGP